MLKDVIVKNKTVYGITMVIIFWYILHLLINAAVVPSPLQTLIEFGRLLQEELLIHLTVSLLRIIIATILATLLGVSLGLFLGLNDRFDTLVAPIVYLLYPIPKVAFLPVLMILFGLGNTPKILLITVIIFFQILVTTRDSVKGLSKELFYSISSLGANKWQTYQHLVIPAVLPKLFTAIRISIGTSIAVLFFAENFATTYGIGYFIMDSWIRVNYVQMFAGIIAISLLGLVLFKMIDLFEHMSCKWIILEKVNDNH